MEKLKVALVHDWLVSYGGAEKVLLELNQLFPQAPIYTALYQPQNLPEIFKTLRVIPSKLQSFPGALARHRLFLPFMPYVFEQFDLTGYDLVISSSHACAKGVITGPSTCHISYIHTPVRYAWDMYHPYLAQEKMTGIKRRLASIILHYLRLWDQVSTMRVDALVCNSRFVQRRIAKYYRRSSEVIYPPVDTHLAEPELPRQTFYLIFSRLVAYKRIDLAIEAFNQLGYPLKIIGEGPERKNLERLAKGKIEFLGYVSEEEKWNYFKTAQALIFPGLEDFGIVPVEAQAMGCPVIAFNQGGVTETVIDGQTGVLFSEQSAESLLHAVQHFQTLSFDPLALHQHTQQFNSGRFREQMRMFIEKELKTMGIGTT